MRGWLVLVIVLAMPLAARAEIVCDGSDITAELQEVVDSGLPPQFIGENDCVLTESIVIEEIQGYVIDCQGHQFRWDGPAGQVGFLFSDTRESGLRHCRLASSAAHQMDAWIRLENGARNRIAPTANRFKSISIQCTNGGCINGIHIARGLGGDANNDMNVFEDVHVHNYVNAALRVEHRQSKTNQLRDFECSGNGTGAYCIDMQQGSVSCDHCYGGGNTGADIRAWDVSDAMVFTKYNFENSARFVLTGGPTRAPFPLTLTSGRWANNRLAPDGHFIVFLYSGPLTLTGNDFEPATAGKAMDIQFSPIGGVGGFVVLGNYFSTTKQSPYIGTPPQLSMGNTINRNDGQGTVFLAGSAN